MTFKTFVAGASAAAITLTSASAAFAQAPAAPAAPAITHGAAIPGICTFSGQAVLGNSTVGKYVITRLQQLGQQANAELNAEQTSLQNDAKALDAQRTTLDQSTLESRAASLQVRDNALQRKAQQRQRELQATEQKAVSRVYTEMEPFVRQAYQAKACAILLDRQGVQLANPAMDITQQVVTALNGKITQFAFDRERLDQAAAPTAAAPPPTQTPAATPRR